MLFPTNAAFAKPEVHEYLESQYVSYAIGFLAKGVLQEHIKANCLLRVAICCIAAHRASTLARDASAMSVGVEGRAQKRQHHISRCEALLFSNGYLVQQGLVG